MIQQQVEVLWNKRIGPGYYKLGMTGSEHYTSAKPGQFVMLGFTGQRDPLLKRPFSIHNVSFSNGSLSTFELLYKVVGKGTAKLALQKRGDILDIFGPLGSGFLIPRKAKHIYVVAGGIGVAPMLFLVSDLFRKNVDLSYCKVFIGGRTKDDLLCIDDFTQLGIPVITTTDDGTAGDQCLVTHPLEKAIEHYQPDIVAACGPTEMLECVIGIIEKYNVPCQVSIESMMACGMGACLGCAVPSRVDPNRYLHACMDGPVFDADVLKF